MYMNSESDSYNDNKVCLTMLCRGTGLKDGRPVETLSGSDLPAQLAECHYRAKKIVTFCLGKNKMCSKLYVGPIILQGQHTIVQSHLYKKKCPKL